FFQKKVVVYDGGVTLCPHAPAGPGKNRGQRTGAQRARAFSPFSRLPRNEYTMEETSMKSAIRLTKIALAAAALTAFAGAAQAETVKIAIAGPMTGAVAQYGDMVKAGALTAVEQINAAGGANGNKFEVVLMDDACEPKQAVAVANKIVSQG